MSIVLFVTSLRLFGTKTRYNSFKVLLFLILFMFCFLGWIQLFADVDKSRELAYNGEYGGILGYNISEYVKDRLAIEGAFIVLGLLMLFSLLIALDFTPKQIGDGIVSFINILSRVVVGLKNGVVAFFSLAQKGTDKIRSMDKNLEMNMLGKVEKGKRGGTAVQDGELLQFDPDIKMVSDIYSKKDLPLQPASDFNINLANVAKGTGDKVNKPLRNLGAVPEAAHEGLDLSQRNYPDWVLPPLELLDEIKPKERDSMDVIKRKARAIEETLKSFNIEAKVENYRQGPAVTQFFVDPAAGVKFTKISNLSKDLALTLAAGSDLRIELIPNTSYIGIDVPNEKRQLTQLRESIMPIFDGSEKPLLGMAVGIDTGGKPVVRDLQKMPHLLVAGATGMGKSFLVNVFIITLLMKMSPDELKFIMIDPKMVEMAPYDGIPHLLTSPITDMSKASTALKWAVNEMEERYKTLKEARVRNIEQYTETTGNLMPYIIIIIDEFSDLMMQFRQEVETSIIRLAQKARAVGIHLIVATQRPTADVITGLIRSNIPARVALTVATSIDSRVILDSTGAETLLGKGDLLFKTANDLKPVRIQGAWYSDAEFNKVLDFIKKQAPDVVYNEDEILTVPTEGGSEGGNFMSDDPLFKQAAEIVIGAQKGSASLLQTKMKIGYARAARLIDELEMAGVVGPQDGPRPREVLVQDLDAFLNADVEA